ncbi:MAG: DUF418 domain-containing protein [Burkholderiaceae bacterium]
MHRPSALPATERIESLDVLRGIALLGIFVMNMPGFSSSFHQPLAEVPQLVDETSALDKAAYVLMGWLFEGKFNGLFSFLFAVGLMLQLQRLSLQGSGASAIGVVLRRMLALLAFGILHITLLWGGDVLHVYAVLGVGLILLRGWSAASLAWLAVALYASQLLHAVIGAARWSLSSARAEQAFLTREMARDNAIYGEGSWWQGVLLRTEQAVTQYLNPFIAWPSLWFWLALATTAVMGAWAWRSGWLHANGLQQQWLASAAGRKRLWQAIVLGSALWWAAHLLGLGLEPFRPPGASAVVGWALGDLSRLVLVAAYAGWVLRWCITPPSGLGLMMRRPLALVGRMPLTQYLLQSLLGTFIFHGWGLGLWEELGSAAQLALAFVLFLCIQIPLAHWWLARHPMGPVEALWRRLSYGA